MSAALTNFSELFVFSTKEELNISLILIVIALTKSAGVPKDVMPLSLLLFSSTLEGIPALTIFSLKLCNKLLSSCSLLRIDVCLSNSPTTGFKLNSTFKPVRASSIDFRNFKISVLRLSSPIDVDADCELSVIDLIVSLSLLLFLSSILHMFSILLNHS